MTDDLLKSVEDFQVATGLSDHRVGYLLARNGRLLERLRDKGRVWPEKAEEIRKNISRELQERDLAPTKQGAE